MSDPQHRADDIASVNCAIMTVSDTRTEKTDKTGPLIRELLEGAGHQVSSYQIIPDEPDRVRRCVGALCDEAACHAVLISGGTGLAPRDSTYEAVVALLEKRLDGFGELFRSLSFAEIGSAAMLSRAVAGVCRATAVFSLPGSTGAVRLAMDKLILPELGHLSALLRPR